MTTRIFSALFFLCGLFFTNAAFAADSRSFEIFASEFAATEAENAAGAVILLDETEIDIAADRLSRQTSRTVIAILDDAAARDYSEMRFGFNSHFSDLTLTSARVLDQNGRIREISTDAVQIQTPGTDSVYGDGRLLSFALPAVGAGSFIEIILESRDKRHVIDGHWDGVWRPTYVQDSENAFGVRLDPIRLATLQVSRPSGVPLNYLLSNLQQKPRIDRRNSKQTWIWTLKNLPATQLEPNMPPLAELKPSVGLSTLESWAELGQWANKIYLSRLYDGSEMQDLVTEVSKPGMTELEKIQAAFYYMQREIRYIGADVSRGGMVPHEPPEVLKNRYGDCKDQSVTLVSLLRAMGIEAYPALIGVYGEAPLARKLPANYFSHMIVYVPRKEGDIWMDTAGKTGAFPGIYSTIEGRTAFVVDGENGRLLDLPRRSAKENTLHVDYRMRVQGDVYWADVLITAEGELGTNIKALYSVKGSDDESMRDAIESVFEGSKVDSLTLSDMNDPEVPFRAQASVRVREFDLMSEAFVGFSGSILSVLNGFSGGLIDLPEPDERQYDYMTRKATTVGITLNIVEPNERFYLQTSKAPRSLKGNGFILESNLSSNGPKATVSMSLTMPDVRIAREEYRDFYQTAKEAEQVSSWLVAYVEDPYRAKEYQLQQKLQASEDDLGSRLTLVRHHIDLGDFDKAGELARQAAEDAPDNGEAQYLLGLVLGFLDDFEGSDDAFKKAEALGYQP